MSMATTSRFSNIDQLRGLVMIIMALDHARDLLFVYSATNPVDLSVATPALFFTRWVTHLCAPTFVFLAGTSAALTLNRYGVEETKSYLLKRGVFLILLDLTVVNFVMWFDPMFRTVLFEVIAAIGFGMIMLRFLVSVQRKYVVILGAGLLIVQGMPFLANVPVLGTILSPLFTLNVFPVSEQHVVVIAYPPLAWLGTMLLGYSVGPWFEKSAPTRRSYFLRTGLIALLAFVVLRFLNVGDAPWAVQQDSLFTVMSFINITKYPPSLLFTLSMVGVGLVLLAFLENRTGRITGFLVTYGRAPLFYFVVHFFLIHVLMIVVMLAQGFTFDQLKFGAFAFGRPAEPSGLTLFEVYQAWIGIVAVMYPLCRWYTSFKAAHPEIGWLKYV